MITSNAMLSGLSTQSTTLWPRPGTTLASWLLVKNSRNNHLKTSLCVGMVAYTDKTHICAIDKAKRVIICCFESVAVSRNGST
jgi:hypothetical protein